jgi:ATP-binding protein involved in chromosome partitioning
VRIGGDSGKPVIIAEPASPVAQALKSVAEQIAARVSVSAFAGDNVVPIEIIE